MKIFVLALTMFLAGTLYAQTPCDCVFSTQDIWWNDWDTDPLFLDTCDLHHNSHFKPGCDTKQYSVLYPRPLLESYYRRIRSTVGWSIWTLRENDWFAHLKPPEYKGERFSIDQINKDVYPAVYDSLHAIFDEFGVTAQLVVFERADVIRTFLEYAILLDKRVEYVEMYDRLNRWMMTVGDDFDSIMIALDYPMPVGVANEDIHDAPRSLNAGYSNGQITVMNDRLKTESFTLITIHGATALHGIAEPGRNSFDVSSLPTGLYLVKLGDRTGKCLIGP